MMPELRKVLTWYWWVGCTGVVLAVVGVILSSLTWFFASLGLLSIVTMAWGRIDPHLSFKDSFRRVLPPSVAALPLVVFGVLLAATVVRLLGTEPLGSVPDTSSAMADLPTLPAGAVVPTDPDACTFRASTVVGAFSTVTKYSMTIAGRPVAVILREGQQPNLQNFQAHLAGQARTHDRVYLDLTDQYGGDVTGNYPHGLCASTEVDQTSPSTTYTPAFVLEPETGHAARACISWPDGANWYVHCTDWHEFR